MCMCPLPFGLLKPFCLLFFVTSFGSLLWWCFPLSCCMIKKIKNINIFILVLTFRWQCLLPECLSHRTWWEPIPTTWWVRLLPRTNSCPRISFQLPQGLWMWTTLAWASQQPRQGWHRYDVFCDTCVINNFGLMYFICVSPCFIVYCSHSWLSGVLPPYANLGYVLSFPM